VFRGGKLIIIINESLVKVNAPPRGLHKKFVFYSGIVH